MGTEPKLLVRFFDVSRLRYWILGLVLLAWLGLPPSGTSTAETSHSTITYGQTILSSIGTAGEVDRYTFSASAGDIVLARMSVTAGALDPQIRIYDPAGIELCDAYYPNGGSAEISSCVLTVAGAYTVLAGDYGGLDSGNYRLSLVEVAVVR